MFLKRLSLIVNLLSLIFIISCTKTEEKPDIVVDIQVSKEGYKPDVIEIPRGKVVLFRITSVDEGIGEDTNQKHYGHCFYIMPPYDVMVENIGKGGTKEVKVKMIYPGHHIFTCPYCSNFFPTKGDIYVK
ncbi:MAG: cupredoxin domain-containing protein [Hydrogenothermaceae bacterium]|nr:cupredoxin domain-containing protein [Hydrogenothermaceae bacterium]